MSNRRPRNTRFVRVVRRSATRLALAGAAAIAAGCIPLGGGSTYQRQEVTAKRPGGVLVSYGGSTCTVDDKTFVQVPIGAQHRCVWAPVVEDGTRRGSVPFTPERAVVKRIRPPLQQR